MDFSQSTDGRLRPSDLGAPSYFPQAEMVRFGERVERPPDLKMLSGQLTKRRDKKIALLAAAAAVVGGDKLTVEDGVREEEGDEEEGDRETNNQMKRRRKRDKLDLGALEGDAEGHVGRIKGGIQSGIFHTGGGRGGGMASVAEMETLRYRSIPTSHTVLSTCYYCRIPYLLYIHVLYYAVWCILYFGIEIVFKKRTKHCGRRGGRRKW